VSRLTPSARPQYFRQLLDFPLTTNHRATFCQHEKPAKSPNNSLRLVSSTSLTITATTVPFKTRSLNVSNHQFTATDMSTSTSAIPECHLSCTDACGNTGVKVLLINSLHTCAACLADMVDRVAGGKLPYPATINQLPVDLAAYATFLDPRLLERYTSKERKHTTHPYKRVHCACKSFIGVVVAPTTDFGAEYRVIGQCLSCEGAACMICKAKLDKNDKLSTALDHNCKANLDAIEKQHSELVNGADRSKKYQICPHCQRLIWLGSACNHISCECGGEFCYICGIAATKDDHHWGFGRGQCR
jgi:hypothetical protein